MKRSRLIRSLIVIALLVLVTSCASTKSAQDEDTDYARIKTIAVLPPEAAGVSPQLTAGAEVLSSLVGEYFQGRPDVLMVERGFEDGLKVSSGNARAQAQAIGRDLGSEAVLVTTVNRFVERAGSRFSSDQPASVAFDLRLVDVASGRTLWFGAFDETQKTVMENIFLLGRAASRGFKFISAADLAREGVVQKLDSSPYFQGHLAQGK